MLLYETQDSFPVEQLPTSGRSRVQISQSRISRCCGRPCLISSSGSHSQSRSTRRGAEGCLAALSFIWLTGWPCQFLSGHNAGALYLFHIATYDLLLQQLRSLWIGVLLKGTSVSSLVTQGNASAAEVLSCNHMFCF